MQTGGALGPQVAAEVLMAAAARSGHRLTEPRRVVARLIAERHGHFTAAELLADAERQRLAVGRATLFRNLELFAELDALERLDLPSGEHAYVACEPRHHHHVVCSVCGRQTEVDDAGVQAIVGEMARRTGYRIERHRLELYGTCPSCRAVET